MTSRSERIAELTRYAEEVGKLAGDTENLVEAETFKPEGARPGEAAIKLYFKTRTEVWRMEFCKCCTPSLHAGWYQASSVPLS